MTPITFRGWNKVYRIANPDAYRAAIDGIATRWRGEFRVKIKDPGHLGYGVAKTTEQKVKGESLTHTINTLRLDGLKVPGKYGDQVKMFEALGYKVLEGINSRGQTCMVVFRPSV